MRIFEETQQFNQWWLYLIILFSQVAILLNIYQNTSGLQQIEEPWWITASLLMVFLLSLIFFARLKTRIDHSGISSNFNGGRFFYKKFSWNEIAEVYIRKYRPLTEYGGWGIRGFGKAKAYSTSGNHGIQIVTTSGNNFLIGTQKPEQVKNVLEYYLKKINLQKSKHA